MKNIYLRKGGYWFSKMTDGKRVWVNLQTTDLPEAIRRTQEIANHPLVQVTHSFLDDVRRFVAYKQKMNQYSRNSATQKFLALKKFAEWLPDSASIANVTQTQIAAYYEELQRTKNKQGTPLSESTAQGYMMTVRSIFRWAVEIERARIDNPVKKVKLAKCDQRARMSWCDRKLKNTLIEDAPTDDLRFILFCGFDAGLRRGEIVEARRDWFDLKNGLLHVRRADQPPRLRDGEIPFRPKDRDERSIPLTLPFRKFLKGYLSGLDGADFALCPTVPHGQAKYRYDFIRPFREYMANKKCEWVTPHVMRHSFASVLATGGVSIFKVAEWLGDDVRVVQRHYAKLAPGDTDIHVLTS